MAHINETITLNRNEGLAVNISRIDWDTDGEKVDGLKSWMDHHFTAADIATGLGKTPDAYGFVTFTEDEFEEYLSDWLSNTTGFCHKGFRWLWDKYRNYKVA